MGIKDSEDSHPDHPIRGRTPILRLPDNYELSKKRLRGLYTKDRNLTRRLLISLVPSFKSDSEKQGLVHTVCACAELRATRGEKGVCDLPVFQ